MVEVGYGRGRVGSELSQLDSRWFVHACYYCTVFVSIVLSEGRDFPLKSPQEELRLKINTGITK